MQQNTLILDDRSVTQKLNRIAYEIYENYFEEKSVVLIGIADRGVEIANQLQKLLSKISPLKIDVIKMQMDKDDPLSHEITLSKQIVLDNKNVILVDDVLNTGKTLAYGVKHLLNYRLNKMNTVVLVDRKHRNYPVRADFVGMTLATTMLEHISVEMNKDKLEVFLK